MAISSIDVGCDKVSSKSKASSKYLKPGNSPGSQLVKIDFATEGSICSIAFKHGKYKKNVEYKSPYLTGDSVQLLSRVTEKRLVHKKGSNIVPRFSLAANICKANSDEFKAPRRDKKTQKSVLTIPNAPAPVSQLCTVSDMNDSEYFNRNDDNRIKTKKRSTPATHIRKSRQVRGKDFEFYDRDAKYCSQMNIKLDCSSTEILNKFNVDEKMSKSNIGSNARAADNVNPHDVWTVLRNINRFQFRPSPPLSEESFISPKKLRGRKRRINKKDMRVFETCCTEEYAYISSYEVDSKSPCSFMSQVCSMDTVIEQQKLFNKASEKLEKKQTKGKKDLTTLYSSTLSNKNVPKNKTIPTKFYNTKKLSYANQKNKIDKVYRGPSFVVCSNKKDDKKLSESNTCHQSFDSEMIKNNYGRDTLQASQHNEFINSVTIRGGASKANKQIKRSERRDKSPILQAEEYYQPINGITKVVVCNGQNVVPPNRTPSPKRKPYQTNTINIQPKLTSTEIRRQLIKHKFPIVVLDKDQLSSTIEVVDEDLPQFNGLDEHVWPFMLNWFETEPCDIHDPIKTKLSENNESTKQSKLDFTKYMDSRSKIGPKQSRLKDKKTINELKFNNIKIAQKIPDIFDQSQEQIKPKPMRQFRDRMLKLLYKNSSVLSLIDGSHSSDTAKNQTNCNSDVPKVNICTGTSYNFEETSSKKPVGSSMKSTTSPSSHKRPWAKAKWASDFIDNVIRKIKIGAYYTYDNKVTNQINYHEPKQVDIQTEVSCHLHDEKCLTIPGFDNAQPAVEIKTMNLNEITVKHCVTNVVVHFDVTIPTTLKANGTKSSALIPVNVTEPHMKVIRCKTSILNAMLPAELCSLVPIMLRSIAESREQIPHLPIAQEKPTHLSTISEVSQCEILQDIHLTRNPMLHIMTMSQELWRLVNGSYKNSDKMYPKLHIVRNTSRLIKYGRQFVQEFMFDITRTALFNHIANPVMPLIYNPIMVNTQKNMVKPSETSNELINPCTVLQPYPVSEHRIMSSYKPSNLTSLFKNIVGLVNYNGATCLSIKNSNCDKFVTISRTVRHPINVRNILTLSIDNFKIDFTFNGCSNSLATNNNITYFTNTLNNISEEPTKCVDYVEITSPKIREKDIVQAVVSVNNNKVKRKGFVKLYKKCKSTSNIYGEKVTPLNKIANLDDFFQALGSGKLLSTVFDSRSREKIMLSIQEMKNWTADINPRQALLLLLLTNKKDTSNLLRFRQVLLQGIAVNRITKAHELDMEIEVIEKENLNRFSQYEGISYLPASIENQDNLFEELCWIAKTTASDYQKPFEESSEKLIKSLLEKRKKLNPSYLRVMARYVGLGLLKSPGKK